MMRQFLRGLRHRRRVAAIIVVFAVVPTILFGLRTYGSFLLLRSAYQAGAPKTSSVRPWMTLDYVATTYRVPTATLVRHLDLPTQTNLGISLKSLAELAGLSPYTYTQRVQSALRPATPAPACLELRSPGGDGGGF